MRFLFLLFTATAFCEQWLVATAFTTPTQQRQHNQRRITSIKKQQYNNENNGVLSSLSRSSSALSVSSSSSTRRPIVAGNWKLNPATASESTSLLKTLAKNFSNNDRTTAEVVVFPPFPFLLSALALLEGSGVKVGAQNAGLFTTGAYTGEVSVSMVRSLGCDYVMLGHSERRAIFGESDEDIAAKVRLALDEPGLGVILCVGETLEEYESDLLESIVDVQLKKGLSKVLPQKEELDRIVVAYEPVWAIGTGKVATPEQAQIAHGAVRNTLSEMFGSSAADKIRIQYGGSVKPDNAEDIMGMPDVDGALVGGASLDAESFTRIVDGAAPPPPPASEAPAEQQEESTYAAGGPLPPSVTSYLKSL